MDVVKIDKELLKEVENFLGKRENKLKYQSKKHFIDIAVYELLGKENNNNINQIKLINKKRR